MSNRVDLSKTALAVTNGGTFPDSTEFEAGKLAEPKKAGYTFGGWYYTSTNGAETKVESNATLTAGTTYTAKWVSKITFNPNGGTLPGGSTSPVTVEEGKAIGTVSEDYTLPTPTKTGATFVGWNTAADGSGQPVTDSTVPTGDMEVYAIWGTSAGSSGYSIYPIDAQTYTGEPLTPAVYVVDGQGNKTAWSQVTYANNTDAGTATAKVTVSGKEYSVNFTINPKPVTKPTADSTTFAYNGSEQTYHVAASDDYTVSGNTRTNAGSQTVTVVLNDKQNTKWADKSTNDLTFNFTVAKATPTISISADKTSPISGGGKVTMTVSGAPTTEGTVAVTCDGITVTDNENGTFSATLPNETKDYTFTASYTAAENGNYKNAENTTCTVSVTRYTSGGGGGGGSSSSSSTTTETTKNSDGSTTTTVTDKKTGTVTETTKSTDGSTLVVETKKDGTVTTTDTAKNGVKTVTVDEPGEAVTAKVTIPRSVGTATVTVPAAVTPGTVAVDAKTGEIVKLSVPTEDGLAVKLDGSADLILVDNSKDFTDTDDHWAEDAIDFATAHEMFNGTTETTFTPNAPMTRAMLMTVLARFDGHDTEGGANWYDKGMSWAKERGVSDGSNPNGNITREQLATMLYRYAGSPAVDGDIGHFSDAGKVSGYADRAMRWAVSTGVIGGMGDGTLNPQGNATRAQVATMLQRFVGNLTK